MSKNSLREIREYLMISKAELARNACLSASSRLGLAFRCFPLFKYFSGVMMTISKQ